MNVSASSSRLRTLLSGFLLVLTAGLFIWFQWQARPEAAPADSASPSEGTIEVFFSDPDSPAASTLRGGVDVHLAEAIGNARYTVDVAVLRLDLWSIRDALIEAHQRGVIVRVVTDDGYAEEDEIIDLLQAGIDVVVDSSDALMHHKFTVIDSIDVWTGSMNYTLNGAYRHNNNLVHLHSREAAADYSREFDEMFEDGHFSASSVMDTPYPQISLDGVDVGIYFSPDDMAALQIVDALESATESIVFMAYSLTLDLIADTMLSRAAAGVIVEGVMEADQASNSGSDVERLIEGGVDLRLDGNMDKMHHKVIIIDGEIVITGSYNFSRSAEERNDENLLIIRSESLAAMYLAEYDRIRDQAAP